MSDFLSNFSGDNYQKTREQKETKKQKKTTEMTLDEVNKIKNQTLPEPQKETTPASGSKEASGHGSELIYSKKKNKKKKAKLPLEPKEPIVKEENQNEVIETDPNYQKKRQKKAVIIGLGTLVALLLLFFGYYEITHVKVPDFKDKELSEVRSWTTENGVKLAVEQTYNFEQAPNRIIDQSAKGKKIKKGQTLTVEASIGPDPEQSIQLPDFKAMKLAEAKQWIAEQKAENIAVIEEYSDSVAKGDYIKFVISNKDVAAESYKRKDKAKVYYSKGKEVFEKNITVPDFSGKTKDEVTEWAKKNELHLTTQEATSDTLESGKVISQSPAKETKIAKKEAFSIVVSTGKALVVPDFSQYTIDNAETKSSGLQIQVKQVFNETIPYGGFISQSIDSGTTYKESDEKPEIQVTYSAGKPYLKDLRDSTLEGDLQKIFYEEYQAKGASITYQVNYVDSSVTKGTVVGMSKYNEFVPINYVVQISISKGNLKTETNTGTDKKMETPIN